MAKQIYLSAHQASTSCIFLVLGDLSTDIHTIYEVNTILDRKEITADAADAILVVGATAL